MKVAICSSGNSLDAMVDPRFGRCGCFAVVDTETMEATFVPNPGAAIGQGAGIQAAQAVAAAGVNAVVAGNLGPNAYQALTAAGILLYAAPLGTVRGAVEQFAAGALTEFTGATVSEHAGMGAGPGPQPGPGTGMGRGMGRGSGLGRGRRAGFRGGRGHAA